MANSLPASATKRATESADLTRLFDDLVRCETRLYNVLDDVLRAEHGIAASQYEFLTYLGEHVPCRVVDLATYFAIGVGAASKGVDRLERGGWVRRVPHPTDRRSLHLELTAAGRTLLARAEESFNQHLTALLEQTLDRQTLVLVAGALRDLRHQLQTAGAGTPIG